VAEVEQGEVLKHPRRRGHPPGKWVEAVAHQSFLPMGREKKTGTTAAFFDEVGAPVAGGVLCRGGEGEEAHAQVKLEKRRQGGGVLGAPLTGRVGSTAARVSSGGTATAG
jgi:hypothetical protein